MEIKVTVQLTPQLEALIAKILGAQSIGQAVQTTTPVQPANSPVAQQVQPMPNYGAQIPQQGYVQQPTGVPVSQQGVIPVAQQPQATAQPNPVPTATAPGFTQEQLARAAGQLMDRGRQQDLIGLLGSFGVQALTMLPKEQYGAFATGLRQLGAQI